MRRWIRNTIFGILLPLTTVTIFFGISAGTLSATLRPGFFVRKVTEHRVYLGITETLPALFAALRNEDPNRTGELSLALREQLTPSAYRAAMEQFFGEAEAWIRGESPVPPRLDLRTLRGVVDPSTQRRFDFLPPFLAIPATPAVEGIRAVVRAIRFVAPLTMLLILLELLGIFATGRTPASRFRRVGVAVILPSVPGILLAIVLTALPVSLLSNPTGYQGLTEALLALGAVLFTAVFIEIGARLAFAFLALLPLSAIFLGTAVLLRRRERATAAPSVLS